MDYNFIPLFNSKTSKINKKHKLANNTLNGFTSLRHPCQKKTTIQLTKSSLYSGSVSCRLHSGVCDGSPFATLGSLMKATRPVASLSWSRILTINGSLFSWNAWKLMCSWASLVLVIGTKLPAISNHCSLFSST